MKRFAPLAVITAIIIAILVTAAPAFAVGATPTSGGLGTAYSAATIGQVFGDQITAQGQARYLKKYGRCYRVEYGPAKELSAFTAVTSDGGYWHVSFPTAKVQKWYVPLPTPILLVNWGQDGQPTGVIWIGSWFDWRPAPEIPISVG